MASRRESAAFPPRRGQEGRCRLAALVTGLALTAGVPAHGATLDDVRTRGHLVCGVSEGMTGFSRADERGEWSGLDVDFCAAVAVAVFGRKDAVTYRPLSAADHFRALRAGEIDLLSPATTWTLSRDTELGIRFVGVLFYDGQGFLVRRGQAVTSVLELSGSSICVLAGTGAEQGLVDFFRTRQMRYKAVAAERWADLIKAYATGGCTLLTGDSSLLALERSRFAASADHMLLPELVTKEPYGPVVRQGDDQWFAIVRWTLMALIAAEELGLTSQNVDGAGASQLQEVRRFSGANGNLGHGMGLQPDWALEVVKQVGNYGEAFDRNVGAKSILKLERGINNLWTKGGLMYAAPFR